MFEREVRLRLSLDNYWHLEIRGIFGTWKMRKLYIKDDLDEAKKGAERLLNPEIINFPIVPPPAKTD